MGPNFQSLASIGLTSVGLGLERINATEAACYNGLESWRRLHRSNHSTTRPIRTIVRPTPAEMRAPPPTGLRDRVSKPCGRSPTDLPQHAKTSPSPAWHANMQTTTAHRIRPLAAAAQPNGGQKARPKQCASLPSDPIARALREAPVAYRGPWPSSRRAPAGRPCPAASPCVGKEGETPREVKRDERARRGGAGRRSDLKSKKRGKTRHSKMREPCGPEHQHLATRCLNPHADDTSPTPRPGKRRPTPCSAVQGDGARSVTRSVATLCARRGW